MIHTLFAFILIYLSFTMTDVVICLERRGADILHMVQLMPLHPKTPSSLASFKSRLALHFSTGLPRCPRKEAVKGCSSSSSVCCLLLLA